MSSKAKIMLVVSALFTLAMGLSNVFVNIFLWKNSNDFVLVANYNLMHYIFVPTTFIFAGWLSKKYNGIWSLRLGIIFFIMFFALILIVKDKIVDYIYPLGILFGIAAGFYWLAFHVLSFDFTSPDNRDTFNGFNGAITGISHAIAPLAAALIIENSTGIRGYIIVFGITLALFVVLIIVSALLRTRKYGENLNYKYIFRNNNKEWGNLRKGIAAWGIRDVIIGFVIAILIFDYTGSELTLGKFTFLAAIISCVAFLLEQKLIKPKRRVYSMQMGGILMMAAVLGLAAGIDYFALLFYIVLDSFFVPFFTVPMSSASFNIINSNHEEDLRIEYVINKELVLNAGRILSISVLILMLSYLRNVKLLNYYLLFIGSAQLISLHFLVKLKIWKTGEEVLSTLDKA
jgi:YQGE family putative transporter